MSTRRPFAAQRIFSIATGTLPLIALCFTAIAFAADDRPNILFCISDDQSWQHTGANGDPVVQTPAFDRVAREGIRFTNPYCDAPSCGPSRSAILSGQSIWRLEQAANIHSTLPTKFALYTELLEKAGYDVGSTGKGWSPGPLGPVGRTINPAGRQHMGRKLKEELWPQIVDVDYAANFEDFLAQHPSDEPFCFWLGTHEPHRGYKEGSGVAAGMDLSKVVVPPVFPDTALVRSDILDYYVEVQHYDRMVERAIHSLEKRGLLDNTILVVTSDHGMPFPRAKASLYDAGTKVPLAIRWPKGIRSPGRVYDGFVNLSDLAPTFLEAAGVTVPHMMTGRSLLPVFRDRMSADHPAAFIAMERHDGCREGGKGYPMRAMRCRDFLYIINFEPGRWPAGDPDKENCARYIPFGEVDSGPTKTFMMESREQYRNLHDLAFAKRPAVELYDVTKDPGQMENVADDPRYASIRNQLDTQLRDHLIKTKDPRLTGGPVLWDFFPYYGLLKTHEGQKKRKKEWAVDSIPSELAKYLPPDPFEIFAPGWKIEGGGPAMKAGYYQQVLGRENVYLSHPASKGTPCILSRTVTIPSGKRTVLSLVVGHHGKGDWDLIVRAQGEDLLKKTIGAQISKNGWVDVAVDLSKYAGESIKLELLNQPTGWNYEGAYWATIAIQSSE